MSHHAGPTPRRGRLLHTLRMLAAVPGARRLPYRSRATIERQRDRRVRAQIRWAYETVPYYRDTMDAAGIRPDRVRSAADLALLPTVSSDVLRDAPETLVSDRYPPDRCHRITTSGRSGVPKPVYHDPRSMMMNVAWGERHEAVRRRFAGPRYRRTVLSFGAAVSVSRHTHREYRDRLSLLSFLAAERHRAELGLPFEDQVALLDRLAPDHVSSLGTFLGTFFREIHERGLETHLPRLITGAADGIPEADRRLIEDELGIPVVMAYQSAESLKIGFQCERRSGYHLHEDLCHVRLLDDESRDVPDGGTGRVHITNLVNRATVLLNYELRDVGRFIAGPCPCGRTLRRMELVEGRHWPMLRGLDGGSYHHVTILDPLQEEGLAGRGQIVVERPDHWRLRLPPRAGRPDDWRDRALAIARGVAGPGIEVTLEAIDEPPRTDSGKWVPVVIRCAGTPPYAS